MPLNNMVAEFLLGWILGKASFCKVVAMIWRLRVLSMVWDYNE